MVYEEGATRHSPSMNPNTTFFESISDPISFNVMSPNVHNYDANGSINSEYTHQSVPSFSAFTTSFGSNYNLHKPFTHNNAFFQYVTQMTLCEVDPLEESITSVAFDPLENAVWASTSNGRIISYLIHGNLNYDKYTCWSAHHTHIDQLLLNETGVVSVSSQALRFNSRQGLLLVSHVPQQFSNISCATWANDAKTNIMVGSLDNCLALFNLELGQFQRLFETESSASTLAHLNSHIFCVGQKNGQVALHDIRANDIQHCFKSHMQSVTSIDVKSNLLVTCGISNSCLNQHYTDPLVKVYDLRMMRSIMPINFVPGASWVRFHPKLRSTVALMTQFGQFQLYNIRKSRVIQNFQVSSQGPCPILSGDISSTGDYLAFGDSRACVQLLAMDHMMDDTKMLAVNLFDQQLMEPLPYTAPSPLWDATESLFSLPYAKQLYLTTSESLSTFCNTTSNTSLPTFALINTNSNFYTPIDLATSCSNTSDFLSHLPNDLYKPRSAPRIIDSSILNDVRILNGVGVIPNPSPNHCHSMSHSYHHSHNLGFGNCYYPIQHHLYHNLSTSNSLQILNRLNNYSNSNGKNHLHSYSSVPSSSSFDTVYKDHACPIFHSSQDESQKGELVLVPIRKLQKNHSRTHQVDTSKVDKLDDQGCTDSSYSSLRCDHRTHSHKFKLPPDFCRPSIEPSKNRYDSFDFSSYNKTCYAGLDNTAPNSHWNSLIQVFFFIPSVRHIILSHICLAEYCIMCELGFLFYMLGQVGPRLGNKTCHSKNFLRALKAIPASSRSDIFEDTISCTSLPAMINNGNQFLIQQLVREQTNLLGIEHNFSHTFSLGASPSHSLMSLKTFDPIASRPTLSQSMTNTTLSSITFLDLFKNVKTNAICNECNKISFSSTFQYQLNLDFSLELHGFEANPINSLECLSFPSLLAKHLNITNKPAHLHFQHLQFNQMTYPIQVVQQLPPILAISCDLTEKSLSFWKFISDHFKVIPEINEIEDTELIESTLKDPDSMPDGRGHAPSSHWIPFNLTISRDIASGYWKVQDADHLDQTISVSDDDHYELTAVISVINDCNDHRLADGSNCISAGATHDRHLVAQILVPDASNGHDNANPISNQEHKPDVDDVFDGTAAIGGVSLGETKRLSENMQGYKPEFLYGSKLSSQRSAKWYLFNDFHVSLITPNLVSHIDYNCKLPCLLYFTRKSHLLLSQFTPMPPSLPSSFNINALFDDSNCASDITSQFFTSPELTSLTKQLAIDTEFVLLHPQISETQGRHLSHGGKSAKLPIDFSLARVSVLAFDNLSGKEHLVIDDYIYTRHDQILDYLTEFSGIRPGNLDPRISPHRVTSLKLVYLKLRYLIQRGFVFVGHGLNKDFNIANIDVPPEQIIDTVQLFNLEDQRKISLSFLAYVLLGIRIQETTHDSIEDARTAFLLFKKYNELVERDQFKTVLYEIYNIGRKQDWKVNTDQKIDIYSLLSSTSG